jgi:hypothetical protein
VNEPANRRQGEERVQQLVRSVAESIVLAAPGLPWCEHGRLENGSGYWCSLRPDVVMCAFCFGAAQAMAAPEDYRCSVCGGPAPDEDHDASVMAKPVPWLGVYFFLCAQCCNPQSRGPAEQA